MCASAVFCSYLGGIRNVRPKNEHVDSAASSKSGANFPRFFSLLTLLPHKLEREIFKGSAYEVCIADKYVRYCSYLHAICSLACLAMSRNKQHFSFAPCLLYSRLFLHVVKTRVWTSYGARKERERGRTDFFGTAENTRTINSRPPLFHLHPTAAPRAWKNSGNSWTPTPLGM